jgi:hypothetical protein
VSWLVSMINRKPNVKPVSSRLAVAAGVLVAVTGSCGLGPLFIIFPLALIIGGLIEPRADDSGRYLTWFGLFLISPFAFFLLPLLARESVKSVNRYNDSGSTALLGLSTLSVLTTMLCIVALIGDAYKAKKAATSPD